MNPDLLEQRHRQLIEQLDAYLDNELSPAERAQMEAHLTGCLRCRRALQLHRQVVVNLQTAPLPRASASLYERIREGLQVQRSLRSTRAQRRVRVLSMSGLGWALAAGLAIGIVVNSLLPVGRKTTQIPMVQAAIADYRQHLGNELPPPDQQQLAALQNTLPFPAQPLRALSNQLIGAWRTTIRGEPAVAFAYRYADHILVQYVVSRELFLRQPKVREAIARQGHLVITADDLSILAFPQKQSGSLVIGPVAPRVLEGLGT